MATLWVREGYQSEFERKISAYTKKVNDISDQYYSASKLVNGYSGDGNVDTSNVYLRKRRSAISDVVSSADSLKTKANAYVDSVVSTDTTVANSIHKESYAFYKKKGIGPQSDSWYGRAKYNVKTTVSDFYHDAKEATRKIVQSIKEFYEEYKYLFNIAADFLKIVAALALFAVAGTTFLGIICAIGAFYALTKATYELATDCLAAEAWLNGDEARAEDLASRTLKGDIIKAGEWIDQKLNTHIFETAFKIVLGGLEICEFVANMMLLFDAFKSIFNLKYRSDGKPLKILDHRAHLTKSQQKLGWTMFKAAGTKGMGARFANPVNWLKFAAWELNFSFKKDATSGFEFIGSLFEGREKNMERIKTIMSDPSSIFKNLPGVKQAIQLGNTIGDIILA